MREIDRVKWAAHKYLWLFYALADGELWSTSPGAAQVEETHYLSCVFAFYGARSMPQRSLGLQSPPLPPSPIYIDIRCR